MSRARPATAPSTRSARTPGPPYCLILRGPLGVGKSTVAEALRRAEGAEVVSIDRLLEEHDLEEWDGDRISLRSFLRANRLAARRVAQASARTRSAIVEGNFYWAEKVDDLVGRLAPPVRVVRLEAPEAVCRARDAGRPAAPRGSSPRAGHRRGPRRSATCTGWSPRWTGERQSMGLARCVPLRRGSAGSSGGRGNLPRRP